jgi:biuret amidohydrolase
MQSRYPRPTGGANATSAPSATYDANVHRHHGLDVPTTLAEACRPDRTALVLYDLQAGILRQIADRERVLARAGALLQAAREANVRVLFVRHVTLPVELMGTSQMRMWMAWQGASTPEEVVSPFPRDAPDSQIVSEVAPGPGEAVLDKLTMSAFEGTPLTFILRDCGVITVVLAGVALEIGIEPTARHAADLGFVPVIATDACGAGNADAGRRTLEALSFIGDAQQCEVDDLREIWAASYSGNRSSRR